MFKFTNLLLKFQVTMLKFKLIVRPISSKFTQYYITFAILEFRITSEQYYPKTLRSSTLYPTHSTNLTQLSLNAQTYTDTSYCHYDLECCSYKLVSHSLL